VGATTSNITTVYDNVEKSVYAALKKGRGGSIRDTA
jgi:hypothetical protein